MRRDKLVSLVVAQDGKVELSYSSMSILEAVEMMHFLRDFFPLAQFTISPVVH